MFENEAGKYVEKDLGDKYLSSVVAKDKLHAYKLGQYDGFIEGAEFGFNKANEWHYPSKGELPKECENVWCYCKETGFKFCCVGHTIVGGDNKVRWWANNRSEELRVIAWKEIILPKE